MQSQICPPNACGDGECVLTTHPTFQYACKCRDGSYKFEPCSCKLLLRKKKTTRSRINQLIKI